MLPKTLLRVLSEKLRPPLEDAATFLVPEELDPEGRTPLPTGGAGGRDLEGGGLRLLGLCISERDRAIASSTSSTSLNWETSIEKLEM